MAITYPLSLPTTIGIASISFNARNVDALSQSPFTLAHQVISHAGQQLSASINLPPMNTAEAEEWVTFLMQLKGRTGTFLMGDPSREFPQGSAGGSPVISGAGQSGSTLSITGAAASVTGWLKAGDYIQVGSGSTASLYKTLTDTNTDGAGAAIIDIWPDLHLTPVDASAVVVNSPVGRWRLASGATTWDVSSASIYGISFQAMEVLP